jgi:hypothetical protein
MSDNGLVEQANIAYSPFFEVGTYSGDQVKWYLASELEAEDATTTMDGAGWLMTTWERTICQETLWMTHKRLNGD